MSRINRVIKSVLNDIQNGRLLPGNKILSIRAGAASYGLSKNTVAEAYERLVAMKYIEPKAGSGFYVANRYVVPSTKQSQNVAQAVDTVSLLREQLVRDYKVRVGDGRPPDTWMGQINLRSISRLKGSNPDNKMSHGYGNPWGLEPLRRRIAQTVIERGIPAGIDNVLLTHGANHGLDLVARQFLQPGDVALVDSPGYYPLYGKLKLSHVKIIGVKRTPTGPDLDDLKEKLNHYKPKVFFTQSLAHNPTGSSITLPVTHNLLKLADQHGLYIIESDPFADILPADSPRLAMLDQLERVIYIGTFSKTLSAAFRVGYLVASAPIAQALCDLKMLTSASSSDFMENIVLSLIENGQYMRHLRRLKERVQKAEKKAFNALKLLGMSIPYGHTAGFYLWASLENEINESALTAAAAKESIFLAPGSLFYPTPTEEATHPALRINIAHATDPRFLSFMRKQFKL